MRDDADIEDAIGRFGDAVLTACLAYLGNRHNADDIFQDTFLKYALHDEPFADDEHRKAWLIRVSINACKDLTRSASSRNTELDEAHDASSNIDHASDIAERSRVRQALSQLPEDQRQALILTALVGYTVPQAAAILKKPQNTIYSHITRGKRKLRKVLGNE
jgi:RNA polymerase sigma factor (sigma-70 family)